MKRRKVLCVILLLMAVQLLTGRYARCEQDPNNEPPGIALILSKPAGAAPKEDRTDNADTADVEAADMPVIENTSSSDGRTGDRAEGGAPVKVEDAELPDSDSAQDHFSRGVAHDKSGMYRKAIESYKQAIMIKPDFAEAYYNLAFSYLLSNDTKSAHEEYMLLKDINPQMAEDLYDKALIMVRSNPENKFVVQAGAFKNIQNADKMLGRLKENYMHARIEAIDGFSKVRVYGMSSKEEADVLMKEISDKFKIAPFLVPVP